MTFNNANGGANSSSLSYPNYPTAPGFNRQGFIKYPSYTQKVSYTQFPSYPSMPRYPGFPTEADFAYRRRRMARQQKAAPFVNPYKDPYAINSLSDVLLNTTAKSQKYGEITGVSSWLGATTEALFDHTANNFVKPLFKGDLKSVFVNTMTSLGEDLDVFSNPIKGMVVESGVGANAAIAGGVGAVATVGVLALLGPIGWGAALGGALVGGGVSATAAAINHDADKALLGFKRGLGASGEGKYNYNIETGNFVGDVITNMALDPMTWATFGGSFAAKRSSALMQNFLANETRGAKVTFAQLWRNSDTIMDYTFTATRGLRSLEKSWGKLAFGSTPIGAGFYGLRGANKASYALANKVKTSVKPPIDDLGIYHRQYGEALNLSTDFKDTSGAARIINPVELNGKVDALHQLQNDSRVMERLMERLEKIPEFGKGKFVEPDISPLRDFVSERLETYLKSTDVSYSIEAATALAVGDVEQLLLSGKFNGKFIPGQEALQGLLYAAPFMDHDSLIEFAKDLLASELTSRSLAAEMLEHARVFKSSVLSNIPVEATKGEVLVTLEETMSQLMGAEGSANMKDILAMMSQGEHNLQPYFQPVLDEMTGILESYKISPDEFIGFMKRGPADVENFTKLAETFTKYSGSGRSFVKETDLSKFMPDKMVQNLSTIEHLTKPSVINNLNKTSVQTVAKTFSGEQLAKQELHQYMFQKGQTLEQVDHAKQELLKLRSFDADMHKIIGPLYKGNLEAIKSIEKKYIDFSNVVQDYSMVDKEIKRMSDHLAMFNGKTVKIEPKDPWKTVNELEKAVKSLDSADITAEMLADLTELKYRLNQPDELYNVHKGLLDASMELEKLATSINKDLYVSGKNNAYRRSVNEYLIPMRDSVKELAGDKDAFAMFANNLESQTYAKLQVSKLAQYNMLSVAAMQNHKELFDQFATPSSPLNVLFDKLDSLDVTDTSFGVVKDTANLVRRKSKAVVSYSELQYRLNDYVNSIKYPESVYYNSLDILTRYNTNSPEDLLTALKDETSDALTTLSANLRKDGMSQREIAVVVEFLSDYLEQLIENGSHTVMDLPGSFFDTDVAILSEDILPKFLDGLVEEAEIAKTASLLEGYSGDIRDITIKLHQMNEYVLRDKYVKYSKDLDFEVLNRSGELYGFKDVAYDRKSTYATRLEGSKRAADELAKQSKGEYSGIMKFPDVITSMKASQAKAIGRSLGMQDTEFSDDVFTNAALFSKLKEDLEIAMNYDIDLLDENTFSKVDIGEKITAISKMQNKAYTSVKRVTDFVEEISMNGDDFFTVSDSYNVVQRNHGNLISSMPPEMLASHLKYNSLNDSVVIAREYIPHSFDEEYLNELAKYGYTVREKDGFLSIFKAVETKEYTALEQYKGRYTYDTKKYPTKNADAINRFYDDMLKDLGRENNFDAMSFMPGRMDALATDAYLQKNPDMVWLLGGQDAADELIKKIHRSRGFDFTFVMPHSLMKNFSGVSEDGISYLPSKPVKNIYNSGKVVSYQNNDKIKYVNTILSGQAKLDDMFTGFSDKEIIRAISESGSIVVAYADKDLHLSKLKIRNQKTLEQAREAGAFITDVATYNSMFQALNPKNLEHIPIVGKALDNFRKTFQSVYNSAYLMTYGAALRNLFDGTTKNVMVTGSLDVAFRQVETARLLREADKVAAALGGDLNMFALDEYFEKTYPDEYVRAEKRAEFDIISDLRDSPAMGSQFEAVADKRLKDKIERGDHNPTIPDKIQSFAYGNKVSQHFLGKFGRVEEIMRSALYLEGAKYGMPDSDNLARVIDTHIDYSTRGTAERLVQILIPFIAFPTRNLMWWTEHMFDNMTVLRALMVTTEENWLENDERAKQIANRKDYAMTQFMNGNLMDKKGNYSTLIKLNPSIFEAFSFLPEMMTDPSQRISAPLKNAMRFVTNDDEKFSKFEFPAQMNVQRVADIFNKTGPKVIGGIQGTDEDWRFAPALMASFFSVYKYDPEAYAKAIKHYKKRPTTYGGYASTPNPRKQYPARYKRVRGYAPRPDFGASVDPRFAKGGRTLSTGYITKRGKFRESGGIGYGNPMHNRGYNTDMHIRFGRKGPWLANAPAGVRLPNPNKGRTMYEMMYSTSGNSRMLNRTKTIKDARGLMFALQDLKYNIF